eukprot:m.28809 g.28809  ORF g.28809 m.28809 type:complete len:232 (+) comp4600_c0_seq2:789-1484(+)
MDYGVVSREVQVLSSLPRSEHIVNYFGECHERDHINIFLEYVPGYSLFEQISTSAPMPMDDVRHFGRQVLAGLSHLQTYHIVHGDLKPQNVMIVDPNPDSNQAASTKLAKICDFGSAHVLADPNVSEYIRAFPTIEYSAPEVLRNQYCTRADMWSFGVIIAQMAAGTLPWDCIGTPLAFKLCQDKAVPVIPAALPDDGADLVRRCLTRDPLTRITVDEALVHPFFASQGAA